MAHVILDSALGPNPSFFLGVCWDRGLKLDLNQGLTILTFVLGEGDLNTSMVRKPERARPSAAPVKRAIV